MGKKSVASGSTLSFSSDTKLLSKLQNAYDKMFMGVLYAMVHGNTFSKKFILLNVVVEFLRIINKHTTHSLHYTTQQHHNTTLLPSTTTAPNTRLSQSRHNSRRVIASPTTQQANNLTTQHNSTTTVTDL